MVALPTPDLDCSVAVTLAVTDATGRLIRSSLATRACRSTSYGAAVEQLFATFARPHGADRGRVRLLAIVRLEGRSPRVLRDFSPDGIGLAAARAAALHLDLAATDVDDRP